MLEICQPCLASLKKAKQFYKKVQETSEIRSRNGKCQICLEKNSVSFSIFNEFSTKSEISFCVNDIIIEITTDILPAVKKSLIVCLNCLTATKNYVHLKQTIINNYTPVAATIVPTFYNYGVLFEVKETLPSEKTKEKTFKNISSNTPVKHKYALRSKKIKIEELDEAVSVSELDYIKCELVDEIEIKKERFDESVVVQQSAVTQQNSNDMNKTAQFIIGVEINAKTNDLIQEIPLPKSSEFSCDICNIKTSKSDTRPFLEHESSNIHRFFKDYPELAPQKTQVFDNMTPAKEKFLFGVTHVFCTSCVCYIRVCLYRQHNNSRIHRYYESNPDEVPQNAPPGFAATKDSKILEKIAYCKECQAVCSSYAQLLTHQELHNEYYCVYCKRGFLRKYIFDRHLDSGMHKVLMKHHQFAKDLAKLQEIVTNETIAIEAPINIKRQRIIEASKEIQENTRLS